VFLINLPVGVISMCLGRRVMPDFHGKSEGLDLAGFLYFGSGIVAVLLGLESLGAGSLAKVVLLCALGSALLAAYVLHAKRAAQPLFSLQLCASRGYVSGVLGNLVTRLGTGGIALMLPLMMQVGFGESAQTAGLMMVPLALSAVLVNTRVPMIINHMGFRRTLVVFTLVSAGATACLALMGPTTGLLFSLPLLMVFGGASTIVLIAGSTLALGDLEAGLASQGNSLLSVSQQLSISLGVACASAVLALFQTGEQSGPALVPAFHDTFVVLGVITLFSVVVYLRLKAHDGQHMRADLPAVELE